MSRLLLLLLLASGCRLGETPGASEGRAGNAHFEAEEYEAATDRYREGIEATDLTSTLRPRLLLNLGLAHLELEGAEEALATFDAAIDAATTPEERALAAYNAGLAATLDRDLERALVYFRRALLEQPHFADARYNYEILRRIAQPPDDAPPPDVEPSDFARQLKDQADALVAERRYADALALMIDGAETDPSVLAYRDFIQRLADIVGIEDATGHL